MKKGFLFVLVTFCLGQNGYFGSISFDYSGTESGSFQAELTDSTIGVSVAAETSGENGTTFFISAIQAIDSVTLSTLLIYLQTPDSIFASGTWTLPPDDIENPPVVFVFLPEIDSTFFNQFLDLLPDTSEIDSTFLDSTYLANLFAEILLIISNNGYLGISGQIDLNHLAADTISGSFNITALLNDIPPGLINISDGIIRLSGFTIPQAAINYDPVLPNRVTLSPAFPNPFNPVTNIRLSVEGIEHPMPVHINVFDINGRWIETLVDGKRVSGEYEVKWNAGDQPSGMYFIRMSTEGFSQVQKVILLK